jgi:uncharacterized membrane protein
VIVLQYFLPAEFTVGYGKAIAGIELALLVGLIVSSPKKIHRHHLPTRILGFVVTGFMTVFNTVAAFKLIHALINAGISSPSKLLLSGSSIWLANIVIFSLWYWDLDRGGPGARAEAISEHPDFLFPQMSDEQYAPTHWFPNYFDYLYVSFTNAAAFSPTDALPLTRWAKMLMFVQSLTSLLTVGLVIARAVNILH